MTSDVLISTPSGIALYDSEQICDAGIITLTSKSLRITPPSCSLHSANNPKPPWSVIILIYDFEPSIIV